MAGSGTESGQPPGRPAPSLAVIGAGVAGCALAAGLRRGGWAGSIVLWEAGRGPGGRAATRRSRHDPGWHIDHGAPLFNLSEGPEPELVEPLLAGGWIEPWREPAALLDAEGALGPADGDPLLSGRLYRGRRGMDDLGRGLLALAEAPAVVPAVVPAAPGSLSCRYGTLIHHLEVRPGGGWRLADATGAVQGEADWLVLSGTLLAHPRARERFGWPQVPLQSAAQGLGDAELEAALAAIASMEMEARTNLMLTIEPTAAARWLVMPFRLLGLNGPAQRRWGLRRLSIQPLADGRCAVVAHGVLAEPDDAAAITALERAVTGALAPWLGDGAGAAETLVGVERRQLMRWGAAFPKGPGLPSAATVCRRSRVAFCGDFIAGPGFGRIEGALRSAQALAGRLLALVLLLGLALGNPATATAAAATTTIPYRCDGDLLLATADNGAVDAPGIPNTVAGTVPGATVLLEWRGLSLQLPRTNNAGPPSYTDGIWWWSLEDPAQPRFLHRRGAIESFSCQAVPAAGPPADGR
ncbi:NAD(P)-binding protein [Cyanobium sp. Candia 9D4]|uniref:NAD(P)-binding protein n=1 Tax=Cyanobium sp. Candia 9D4 TaxID=2823707 RepID=UPI0028F42870|nr:NAD(P)-binding protein [Cyanobium sp. Candia 9D4]MCP9932665.1 NAD(P)-binding protein [Cyanobium sp. Candia 9D4]